MYRVPESFHLLARNLTAAAGSMSLARLMIHVELTLFLAQQLGLECEPLTVGWVLLSRMPINHPLLNNLTPEQRRMLANAAIIVPLSSRYAWESALARYATQIPARERLYTVPMPMDETLIDVCRQRPCPDPAREDQYYALLTEDLPFERRNLPYAAADTTYNVRIKISSGEMRTGRVTITDAMAATTSGDAVWFDTNRPRTVLTFCLHELLPTAQFLDRREQELGGHVHWERDLAQIRYRQVTWVDGRVTLEGENEHMLHLEGTIHLPGVVSAGKTTLAKLIIAHCIRLGLDVRITLVVGDSHTAIEIAHQVNSWFYADPAGDHVVAVPILGASQRETHLGRLLSSREYARSLQAGRPHWGERWLMPACPLASSIQWEGDSDVVIPAGGEPCERLMDNPRKGKGKGSHYLCPQFQNCPAKQMYRDMPRAQLWVTTSGALSQAALPLHLDGRIGKMGDLVYDQSDLVILDEVETIVDWYDRTFAQREELTNGKNGLLDRLEPQITRYWNSNRVLPPDYHRWIITARELVKVLSGVLTAIADSEQERVVKQWVQRGFFSPNQLAYRLARRLAGLKEWDSRDTPHETRQKNNELTDAAFAPFDQLLNRTVDPLRWQATGSPSDATVGELARLIQTINNLVDNVADEDLFRRCRQWIMNWHPDIEARLAALRDWLEKSQHDFDHQYLREQTDRTVDDLARRLQFTLMVALLDRHMHIVLHEWHNKPDELDAEQPFSRIPRGMRNILPMPLTGQQYGFVSDRAGLSRSDEARNRLSLFAYTNIGRSYLLNFDHLREDLEGMLGPHVLALSGTSYLPDSTAFHVPIPPTGILMPPSHTEAAIRDSRFIWQYFVDERGKPIFVSGERDKAHQFRVLMKAMLDDGGLPGGFLGKLLKWLETQGEEHPDQWADRARILLLTNSYDQSRVAAQTLRQCWGGAAKTIYDLKRGRMSEDYVLTTPDANEPGGLRRIDIEQFAYTGGRILVAPMQSIGRGFNILNKAPEPKAAFGAVCLLTRPMPQPHDLEATAQELNRHALAWAADEGFAAWQADTLYRRAQNARESAMELRRNIEYRHGYPHLLDKPELHLYPRRDLAATTAGRIIQAVGRLLRGGVPFRAYFVDAAWSPELAKSGDVHARESAETSLLTAVIDVLSEYAEGDEIGKALYGDLSEALITTENRDSN